MLPDNLEKAYAEARQEPLWSAAGYVALAAMGTSVAAQFLVLLISRGHGTVPAMKYEDTPLSLARGALVVQSALAILIGIVLSRHRVLRKRAIALTRVPLVAMFASLGLVLGLAPVANDLGFRLSEALTGSSDSARWVAAIIHQATRSELLLLAFTLTLLPACIEELLFRGLLMGALAGAPRAIVVLLQALAFGAFHVDLAQGIATFVLGLGFGFMRLTTRSLRAPMLAHAAYNLLVLLSMRWMEVGVGPMGHEGYSVLGVGLVLSLLCALALARYSTRAFGRSG
jgi:membrane protease YdiL (CAAX protease family)